MLCCAVLCCAVQLSCACCAEGYVCVMLCYVMFCYVVLCWVMLCFHTPGRRAVGKVHHWAVNLAVVMAECSAARMVAGRDKPMADGGVEWVC